MLPRNRALPLQEDVKVDTQKKEGGDVTLWGGGGGVSLEERKLEDARIKNLAQELRLKREKTESHQEVMSSALIQPQ